MIQFGLTAPSCRRKADREEKLDNFRAMEAADQSMAALEHKCVAVNDVMFAPITPITHSRCVFGGQPELPIQLGRLDGINSNSSHQDRGVSRSALPDVGCMDALLTDHRDRFARRAGGTVQKKKE